MTLARRILGLALVCGLLLLAYWHYFPNEEKRVRKTLARVAESASIPAQPTPAGAIIALSRLQDCFSRDVQVEVEIPIEGRRTFTDREDLMQAAKAAWGTVKNVQIEFLDVNVTLDDTKENATAELTARVTHPGERDFFVQEFRLRLKKQDGDWRITRAESVKVLR
jgi:hypothetical protein